MRLASPFRVGRACRRTLLLIVAVVSSLTCLGCTASPDPGAIPSSGPGGVVEVLLAWSRPPAGRDLIRVDRDGLSFYVGEKPVVSDADIAKATATEQADGRDQVLLELTSEGAAKLHQATVPHVGEPLMILIDGRIVSCPDVASPIACQVLFFADAESVAKVIARHGR
jgi:hypothetical protein